MDDKAIDRRRHNFTITDNEVIDGISQIGVSAFAVYSVIVRMANEQNKCFPGQKYIAGVTGLSERTVRTAIAMLSERDLIRITKTTGFQNTYTILPVKKTLRQKETPANISEPRQQLPEGAATIAGGVRQPLPPNKTYLIRQGEQDAPQKFDNVLPVADQVLLPVFKKVADALGQPDLPPLPERLQALRLAAKNIHIGGYDNIVKAARNLARSNETDSHKTFDWLVSEWPKDRDRRITSFMNGKQESKREVNYVEAPEKWRKRYDESTPR